MTLTTDFITELYRAANEVDRLTPFEARRLLERAARTIRDMRDLAGDGDLAERLDDRQAVIEDFARGVSTLPPQLLGRGLLDAADMIRALRIIVEAEDVSKGTTH